VDEELVVTLVILDDRGEEDWNAIVDEELVVTLVILDDRGDGERELEGAIDVVVTLDGWAAPAEDKSVKVLLVLLLLDIFCK
jgi:hypothetical protein